VDDYFDATLTDAVKNYQKANQITVTGIMGPVTTQAILTDNLKPVTVTLFKPDEYITRADICKIDILVEKL
jgi:peptidoglycan hydrolase-like protein with peptidoglycan-binding domain